MAHNLGTARGTIRIEYDSRGVARARNHLGQFVSLSALADQEMQRGTKSARAFSVSMGLLGKAFLATTKWITIVSTASTTLATAVNAVAAAAIALAPAVGAGLAAIPGIVLTGAAALGVLKLAFVGVGDAMKAALENDPKKFAEAVKGLAPSAREAVTAFRDLVVAVKPLQQAVQQAFFADSAGEIKLLQKAILSLRGDSVHVATAMNTMFQSVLRAFSTPQVIRAMSTVMQGLAEAVVRLTPGLTPLINGFAALGAKLAPFVAEFTRFISVSLFKFGDFLASIDLAALFASAGNILSNIGAVLSDLADIGKAVFAALGLDGAGALGVIGELIAKIAEFVKSTEGAATLNALGTAMQSIASSAGRALIDVLGAIAPAITAVAPLLAQVFGVMSGLISGAMSQLAPVVLKLASTLSSALAPVLPVIGDALGKIVVALGPVIEQFAEALGPVLVGLAPVIAQLAVTMSEVLVEALVQLLPAIQQLLPEFIRLAVEVLPQLLPMIIQLGNLFIALLPAILAIVNIMVSFLLPVLREGLPLWGKYIEAMSVVVGWIAKVIGWFTQLVAKVTSVNSLTVILTGVFNTIKTLLGSMVAPITTLIPGAFKAMLTGSSKLIGELLAKVKELPGGIKGALFGLGSLLFDAGVDIIRGLINGINNMADRVQQRAREIANSVKNAIKGALSISSPSKVMIELGKEVSRGLALGIVAMANMVSSAAESSAQAALNGFSALPMDASLTVSGAVLQAVSPGFTPQPPVPSAAGAGQPLIGSVTINAPQGMNAEEIARLTASRLNIAIATGF